MKNVYIGIDPGFGGGIAMKMDEKWFVDRYPRSRKVTDVKSIFNHYWHSAIIEGYDVITYIEKVWAMPHDGRSSAFKFGMNYGIWLGIVSGNNIIKVTPRKWQSHYGVLPKEKKERKQMLKELAIDIVKGQLKPTLHTCDAILIAKYGKENYGNNCS